MKGDNHLSHRGKVAARDGRREGRAVPGEDLYSRSREIGAVLLNARKRSRRSMRECAEHIGTSRQRYAGFEAGTVFVGAVELEALMRFLNIRPFEVWPSDMLSETSELVLQAQPGETLRTRVNVAQGATDTEECGNRPA